MKKPFKSILYLLLVVPTLFVGCQKSEVLDNSSNSDANKSVTDAKSAAAITYAPCGNQLVANLYEYKKTEKSFGTVTVGNDLVNLYVTYQLNPGYSILGTYLYVGTPEGLTSLKPKPSAIPSGGTGSFSISSFPFVNYPYPQPSFFTKVIPLSSLPDCFIIVAFAELPAVNGVKIFLSAKAPTTLKSYGYYLEYCKQRCSIGECETAYAYGNDLANCFITTPDIASNNWGWTNGPISSGTYDWPIYAGAGQCDISKGTLVGSLHVVYDGSTATVSYNMNANYHLSITQLWVGNDKLPLKNGAYTTAPGQFPYKHEGLNGVSSNTFTIPDLSGSIYIAAHSEVCW